MVMAEIRTLFTCSLTVMAIGLCACPPTLQAQTVNPQSQSSDKQKPLLLWLNAGFYSAHFNTDKGLRNSNPGLGVEAVFNEDWSATAGTFTNSDDARSNYLGAYYQPWHWGSYKAGVVGGVFNGYPKAFDGGWFPALLPVVTWEGERFGLNIAFVPPLQNRLYGAISFQLKLRAP
jgi:hypothetical protein